MDRPLNILQLCSSAATSGAERHVFSLSEGLRERGHRVQVVTPGPGWLTTAVGEAGIPVRGIRMKGFGWYRTMAYLAREVRRSRVDVVHTHLTRAAYIGHSLGLLTRVPIVTSVHIANNDVIYKRLARGHNRLVAVSEYVAGMLHGRGVPRNWIETVYNGTDVAAVPLAAPEGVYDELRIPRDRRLVGLVAKICPDKGQVELLRAMKDVRRDHPDAHVLFVGKVEETHREAFEDAIAETGMGDRVTVTGVRHDVPRLLDAMTLATLPSVMETFGMAVIEASARGRAIVGTNVGALPEVIQHGRTGLLVDLRPEAIAEGVSHLLAEDALRERMGAEGRAMVEARFTLERMVERFEAVYARASR